MLLVHTCCTTCALNLLKSIEAEKQILPGDITLYFYNPNIHPESEWHARRRALQDTHQKLGYQIIIEPWTPKDYFNRIKSLGDQISNSQLRCPHCYLLRLEKTFQYATTHGYDTVTTTMLTSSYMDKEAISRMGQQLANKYHINFYQPQKLHCLSCTKGFYKQNYCGCVFSLEERLKEKYL